MKKITTYHGAGILCYTRDEQGDLLVLLGKRSVPLGYGKWSIPGGCWEKQDGFTTHIRSYENTAIRETREEFGIDIPSTTPLWAIKLPFFHYEVFSSYLIQSETKTRPCEFSEIGWFRANALPKAKFPFVSAQVRALLQREG